MPVPNLSIHPPDERQVPRRGRRIRGMCARCCPALGPQRRTIETPVGPVCAPCLEWLQISGQLPVDPPDPF
jgi:hypothetical protein